MPNPIRALRVTKVEELLENIINRLGIQAELLRTINDCSAEEALQIVTRAQEGLEIIGNDLEEVNDNLAWVINNG